MDRFLLKNKPQALEIRSQAKKLQSKIEMLNQSKDKIIKFGQNQVDLIAHL